MLNVTNQSKTFSALRMLLGIWMLLHFLFILPEVKELYSLEGIKVAGGELYLAAPLKIIRSALGIQFLCVLAILSSLGLIFKVKRRLCTFILFIVWIFFFHQNVLTYTPLHPFMGWILLAISMIKDTEVRFPWNKVTSDFNYSTILFSGFWIICACAYTSSGIQKYLFSPLWAEGKAIEVILNYPAVRFDWLSQIYSNLPNLLKISINHYTLFFEGFFLLALLHKKLRYFFWLGILGMHLGILLMLDFTELTLGMLIIHGFLIEDGWFKQIGLGDFKWKLS